MSTLLAQSVHQIRWSKVAQSLCSAAHSIARGVSRSFHSSSVSVIFSVMIELWIQCKINGSTWSRSRLDPALLELRLIDKN